MSQTSATQHHDHTIIQHNNNECIFHDSFLIEFYYLSCHGLLKSSKRIEQSKRGIFQNNLLVFAQFQTE